MKKYFKLGMLLSSILTLSACGSSGGGSHSDNNNRVTKPITISKKVEALKTVVNNTKSETKNETAKGEVGQTSTTVNTKTNTEIEKMKDELRGDIRNNLEIKVTDDKNMKSEKLNDIATNTGTIDMKTDGNKDVGIFAARGGKGINEGTIKVNGVSSDGMGAYNGSKIINAKNEEIIIGNESVNSIGMYVSGEDPVTDVVAKDGSIATNLGIIKVEGVNSIGIYGTKNAKIVNGGTINLDGLYIEKLYDNPKNEFEKEMDQVQPTGIFAAGENTVVENDGTININTVYGIGINAEDGAKITNGINGVINLNAEQAVGISADGKNTVVTNDGTINLNSDDGVGIQLSNGATLNNNSTGTIHIKQGTLGNKGITNDGKLVNNGSVIINK